MSVSALLSKMGYIKNCPIERATKTIAQVYTGKTACCTECCAPSNCLTRVKGWVPEGDDSKSKAYCFSNSIPK